MGDRPEFADHVDHEWEQVGRCVWCKPCSVRLYQGEVATGPEKAALAAIYEAAIEQHGEGADHD